MRPVQMPGTGNQWAIQTGPQEQGKRIPVMFACGSMLLFPTYEAACEFLAGFGTNAASVMAVVDAKRRAEAAKGGRDGKTKQ